MIRISDPEVRRGIRTMTQSMMQFAVLIFLVRIVDVLSTDAFALRLIALAALGVLGLSELGYVMENGLSAFRVTATRDGLTMDAGSGNNGSP